MFFYEIYIDALTLNDRVRGRRNDSFCIRYRQHYFMTHFTFAWRFIFCDINKRSI